MDLHGLADEVVKGVKAGTKPAAGWRESDLEEAIIEWCGSCFGPGTEATISRTGRKRLRLENWSLYHVDLVARTADTAEHWIEVKWATSAREVWWLAWDALKLAAASQQLGGREEAQPASTLIVAAVPVKGGDRWMPINRAELETAKERMSPVLSSTNGEWREIDVIEGLVRPTLPSWLFCAHENAATYPGLVPKAFRVRGVSVGSVRPGGNEGIGWDLHVVEIDATGDLCLVTMPGSAGAPISHVYDGHELGRTAVDAA